MRELRLKSNGKLLTEQEYRELHPRVSFANEPNFVPSGDADLVVEVAPPEVTKETQYAVRDGVEVVNGRYRQKWAVRSLNEAEVSGMLEERKLEKIEEINNDWLSANTNYFNFKGKKIASDEIAHQSINGTNGYIALFGEFHRDWPGGWKALDNTYVSIGTVDEWKEFYKAMVSQGQANFAYAQELKNAVATATTLEELAEIRWAGPR